MSAYGTFRTSHPYRRMSTIGGKADMSLAWQDVRYMRSRRRCGEEEARLLFQHIGSLRGFGAGSRGDFWQYKPATTNSGTRPVLFVGPVHLDRSDRRTAWPTSQAKPLLDRSNGHWSVGP